MDNNPISQENQYQDEINYYQTLPDHKIHNIPLTTKYTHPHTQLLISDSFVIGKNNILENNTQSSLDSDGNDSQLSFQERLHSKHQKFLTSIILKYLEFKGLLNQKESIPEIIGMKSTQLMKQIEERTFDEIKRLHGNNEVEKIKLVLKFIKRNQNLAKIYFQVIKTLPTNLQTTLYFLFKQSVMNYLECRQQIVSGQNKMTEASIKQYLQKNMVKICEQISKDEKLQFLHCNQQKQIMIKRYEEFIMLWMEGFILCKEGFPSGVVKIVEKTSLCRVRVMENKQQREKRKKIKKF